MTVEDEKRKAMFAKKNQSNMQRKISRKKSDISCKDDNTCNIENEKHVETLKDGDNDINVFEADSIKHDELGELSGLTDSNENIIVNRNDDMEAVKNHEIGHVIYSKLSPEMKLFMAGLISEHKTKYPDSVLLDTMKKYESSGVKAEDYEIFCDGISVIRVDKDAKNVINDDKLYYCLKIINDEVGVTDEKR